jgi:hypothetical protein
VLPSRLYEIYNCCQVDKSVKSNKSHFFKKKNGN